MIFSKKTFRFIHKIALFAIIFASFVPSISHALAPANNTSFAQEVCTTNGSKITIQVLTTKGKQLATELPVQLTEFKTTQIKNQQASSTICSIAHFAQTLALMRLFKHHMRLLLRF